ncbi:MAG TPA: 16S rRNA (cytosine(967)-C(5))-methyltransferase RsmB, partial [Ruminococcaceae bacterium]|nr:16S rRNA (cytosine(967)-C(5))-methyltransferase RsmB [Oscillospiraceae bacterium]
MSKSARQSAFEILYKVERSGAYSNLALDAQLSSKDGADGDSALLTALV